MQRYCIKEGNRAGCFLPGWVRVTAPPGPFDPIATPITEHVNGQGMEAFAARDVVNAEGLPLSMILCDSPCSPCSCHLEAVCNALSMRTGRERRHSRRFAPVAKLKQR